MRTSHRRLSDSDFEFLAGTVAEEVTNREQLKRILKEDEDFRNAFLDDRKTARTVMVEKDVFLKISPTLYFEVLLRMARKELESASHTIETAGTKKIAVFDTNEVVELLSRQTVLEYLADMLASFTRIESYALSFRSKRGVWRKVRFNDVDMDSLMSFCDAVDREHRFGFFKRIADLCLFILGVFPEYVRFTYRYPHSREVRPPIVGRKRRSTQEYEEEGRKFYKLAAGHPVADTIQLSRVLWLLHGNFHAAQKPLNFIAQHYLHNTRHNLFGIGAAWRPQLPSAATRPELTRS